MKNKLNLKGQFNNSQTAVNPTEVGPATVNRRSRLMSVLCLFTLLSLGVGQMWGETMNGPRIYFDNSAMNMTTNQVYFVVGHSNYSRTYGPMTLISNTKLLYRDVSSDDNHYWTDATYVGFIQTANRFNDGSWGPSNLNNASNYTAANTSWSSIDWQNTYYCKASSKGGALSVNYISGGYGSIQKYNATQKAKVRNTTAVAYSDASGTLPATLKLKGTYLSGDGASTRSEITSTSSTDAAAKTTYGAVVTGLITHSYASLSGDYKFEGWGTSTTPSTTNASYEYNISANTTVYAFFTRKWQVTFGKGGTSGTSTVAATAGGSAISNGTKVVGGTEIVVTATPATGYEIVGWYSNSECTTAYTSGSDGVTISADKSTFTLAGSSLSAAKTIYAKFQPKTYTVTLSYSSEANYGSAPAGVNTSVTATYGEAMPAMGTAPKATNGYGFYGYYTEANGNGTKYYNADGTSAKDWDLDENTTLYAYFRQAAITGFTFDAATVAPGGTVGVTPTIDPTPEGTTFICWEIQYSNGNPLDPQPTDLAYTDGKLTFTASETSGTYKVEATLHLGADCEGTVLSTAVQNFQVAGDHTVTVQYKCGNTTIAASTTVNGKPLEWSEEITPPDIFGYTFLRWVAKDGVSITTDNGTTTVDSTTTSTIKIKANYDGSLLARYTQKRIIYFKNTLGWSDVYVNLLDGDYWGSGDNANKGTGNKNKANKNLPMTRIGETDVWYYEYGNKSTTQYVSFTQESMDNYEFFYQNSPNVAHVVFPTRNSDALTTNKNNDNGFYAGTPMFVPRAGQTGVKQNSNRAEYYNEGYWTKYTPGTGYILRIYNEAGNTLLKTAEFTSADELMPMTAVVDLEATTTYKFELMREGDVYYGNENAMTYTNHGQDVPWEMSWKEGGHKCGLTTNAAGEYTFHLTYSAHSNQYRLRMSYDYPIKGGDYRVIYKDGEHTNWHPSAIVPQVNNGKDTVSFFIRPGDSPVMKIQQATVDESTGAITWSAGTDVSTSAGLSSLPKDSVYNICLKMDGTGAISVENVEGYTGNYYIRTDAANNKWDNYKSADHMMTYSEYSERNSDYTHYWMTHVWANANVKFVVANDYSPCISDTLVTSSYRGGDASHIYVNTSGHGDGDIKVEANIRFMWNKNNNAVYRAYLSGGKEDGSKFLVLRGTDSDNIKSQAGELLTGESKDAPGNNHGAGAHCMQFTDDENWIYETTVQVLPSSYVKLYALFNGSNFYYKGEDNDTFDGNDGDSNGIPNAIQLITGGSSSYLTVRVIYDFKTDRLLAALLPEGNIDEPMPIHADVMFIREHQEDIAQLTFTDGGKITDIKTAYAVMRFNKWTLNNKSTINTGTTETPVHLPLASPLSRYERDVFYVSFPFDVNLNEVFGFGTYGVHWIMEYYDGAARAANGFWKDTPSYWRFITNRNGYVLKKNVGYILALDLDELGEESSVWANNNERAELFFPSSGTMPDIKSGTVTAELDEHTCTIVRNGSDRTKADSHWNIMGVPTYINTTNISYANTEWTNKIGPKFLYTWNSADNTLTPTSASGFTYHAMHAYTVQYCGNVTWTTSVSPSSIVARQKQEPSVYEWCLELQQYDQMTDRTYVRMSDEEEVTSGFEFGYDMSKSMNRDKANIYTFIGSETVAGNSLPLQTEQTTVVPVGVTIKNAGEYTFAMPEGTNGVGVTLVDTEANVRTSLSALDYTVSLEAGEYTGRFMLEISPVQNTPTDIEAVSVQPSEVRKVMIDGILYIVKDGKMYDARGARVE